MKEYGTISSTKKKSKTSRDGFGFIRICMAAILASTLPATPVFAAEDPLTISETDPMAVKESATATTTDRLNLRAGAGSSYEVLTVLELGAQVTVLDDSNAEWVKGTNRQWSGRLLQPGISEYGR